MSAKPALTELREAAKHALHVLRVNAADRFCTCGEGNDALIERLDAAITRTASANAFTFPRSATNADVMHEAMLAEVAHDERVIAENSPLVLVDDYDGEEHA